MVIDTDLARKPPCPITDRGSDDAPRAEASAGDAAARGPCSRQSVGRAHVVAERCGEEAAQCFMSEGCRRRQREGWASGQYVFTWGNTVVVEGEFWRCQ